jgi:hypothetical protein
MVWGWYAPCELIDGSIIGRPTGEKEQARSGSTSVVSATNGRGGGGTRGIVSSPGPPDSVSQSLQTRTK